MQWSVRSGHLAERAIIAGVTSCVALCVLVGTPGMASAHGSPELAKAKKALFVLSDMPKGWTSSSSSNNNNQPFPDSAQLAACLGIPTRVINYNAPAVYSRSFTNKDQDLTVGDSVQVYPSVKAARQDFAVYAGAKTPHCMTTDLNGNGKASFAAQLGGGVSVGSVIVTKTPAADYGAHTANITMFFPFTTQEQTINTELIIVDFVSGKVEQTVVLSGFQTTFPPSLARRLTTVADGRIEKE
jgi:hypothetical protein